MKVTRVAEWFFVLASLSLHAQTLDLELAAQYFDEAGALCLRDEGKLWGVSLCGPLLIVEPRSRGVAANHADAEGRLRSESGVWTGTLPAGVNAANTAITWAGVKWTMLLWPLPASPQARARLLAHEMWHRIQDRLGLPLNNPANAHLDSTDGRVWMQLEWRALAAALRADPQARQAALRDALLFRAERRRIFPGGAGDERALEMNEGLANYTGVKLGAADATAYAAQLLDNAGNDRSFVRSFAYASGPAYGLLLDDSVAAWRAKLRPHDDLGALLAAAHGIALPADTAAEAASRAPAYGGAALRAAETARETARRERLAMWRARLIDGPILVLPLSSAQFSFDPNEVMPLDDHGSVYPNARVSDKWGVLSITGGGVLIHRDFSRAHVGAPADAAARPLSGPGWKLDLADGWRVEPGARSGDLQVVQRPAAQ